MKHGSLFSGIGGFDLGFERAGIETIWQVEIDEYCRKVLARHFPHAQRFSDIRECGAHNLPPVDVLSGGFPCQDISNAGKRAGIDGERSGLWSEYARIIRELRPRYVIVENVAALLGRGMERVLGDLAAIGYDAEWQSIRASDVGAPHRRERIWICAYSRGQQRKSNSPTYEWATAKELLAYSHCEQSQESNNGKSAQRFDSRRCDISDAQCCDGQRLFCGSYDSQEWQESRARQVGLLPRCGQSGTQWALEPNVGRVAHGIPARVDRLRGLGNAIVPQIAEWIGQRLLCAAQRDKEE